MTHLPTDKTYCAVLQYGYKIYLTKKEANFIIQEFASGKELVIISDKALFKKSVLFIIPSSEIEKTEKTKRGEWICDYGYWHSKNQECGHNLTQKLPNQP